MKKITQNFYQAKTREASKVLFGLFVLLLMGVQVSWSQQSIGTGQFDGGFENAVFNTTQLSATTPHATSWSHDSTTNIGTSSINNDGTARSGTKHFNLVNTVAASGKYLMSPVLNPALSAGVGNNYTVQYYVKSTTADYTKGAIYVSSRGSGTGTQSAVVNGWQKVTYRYTGVATAAAASTWIGVGTNKTSILTVQIDDVVVYAGTDDNALPDAPTVPVVSGLNVSWTAPSTGVDSGGYMVVRYATNPNADNDPNINGVYAVGNTITNGTGSLSGTVVYVGIATSFTDGVSGSVSGSDYYKIYTVDKAFNYSVEITGTAPAATTWDGIAWSNGIPSASLDAIIAGNYSTANASPEGAFTAKKLTVNSGVLTIASGTSVTVLNEVINNAVAANVVVENNANLIQLNDVVNTGAITVNRNSNSLKRLDYTLWSSPVNGAQTLANFSPLTAINRFQEYNPATNLYNTVDRAGVFSTAKGYLIRMPNENPSDLGTGTPYYLGADSITYNGVFTGTPNNGSVNLTGLTANNFYAVGNPYPSTISATTFLAANPLSPGTLYFWRKTNNPVSTSYATWTTLGGVANTGGGSAIVPNGSLQVGQGFIISTGTATALNFTNAMREVAPTSTQFLKTKAAKDVDRLWLNLTTESGVFSQALVGYIDGATVGVDNGIDGKYINDSKIALTSNIDNEEYVIQGRPTFDASDVVPLNFKTDVAGDYTIGLDHVDGLFATGQDVYLVDATTGTETDLKAGNYTFAAPTGTSNARFSLKYQKTLGVGTVSFNENSVAVYAKGGTLYVSANVVIAAIKVYDIQGKLIAELKNGKSTSATIANLKATNQVLVVKVTSQDNAVVIKKVVN